MSRKSTSRSRSRHSKSSGSANSSDSGSSRLDDNLSDLTVAVYDNTCFVIVCEKHNRILLTKGTMKFFPHVPLGSVKTWYQNSVEGVLQFLLERVTKEDIERVKNKMPFTQFMLIHIFRFQLPQSQRFITRLIYLVRLDPKADDFKCCHDRPRVKWFDLEEAKLSKIVNLWGPEVSYFSNAFCKTIWNTVEEYTLPIAIMNINNGMPQMSSLLSQLTVHNVERVYADFIVHTFPSFFLTRDSFRAYMARHEIENKAKVVHRYFAAFRMCGKMYMQFTELLLGLVAIDLRTPHSDARAKFVFRYYDYDKDDHLNFTEFRRMLRHIVSNPSDRVVKNEMTKIGAVKKNGKLLLSYDQFKVAVGTHAFRGTSRLCRVSMSPFERIIKTISTRKVYHSMADYHPKELLLNRQYQDKCASCKSKQPYGIASTLVFLGEDGNCTNFQPIVPQQCQQGLSSVEITFNPQSICHFMIDQIRQFCNNKGTPEDFKGLFSTSSSRQKEIFFSDVQRMCNQLAELVENEDRVLKVAEPTCIIGDIHGNIEDLLSLEQSLWRSMPMLTNNYLFLGDFVDRGRWGFECFLYLMALKLLCPTKIFLLRGNHEVRPIQIKYSFHEELLRKYGKQYGQAFFDLYNFVFDRLPFCAVINQSVYCAHGGISAKAIDLEIMNNSTARCLPNPEHEAPWVWETLWSDPMEFAQFEEAAAILGQAIIPGTDSYMFLENRKRGASVLFNDIAAFEFLKFNHLQYIIRAHEVPADGFKFNFGRLCTTIFSCSHYCHNHNEAAVIRIGREARIRVIRIDTSNNECAMEKK